MSVSTRSNRTRTASPAKSVSAEEVVSAAIEANRKYVAKVVTTGVFAEYRDYAVNEAKGVYKTKAENEAFVLGVRLGGLQSKFQNDRKAGKIPSGETLAEYAIRTSGVDVPEGNARTALLAGIATISRYRKIRNAIDASKVSAE